MDLLVQMWILEDKEGDSFFLLDLQHHMWRYLKLLEGNMKKDSKTKADQ